MQQYSTNHRELGGKEINACFTATDFFQTAHTRAEKHLLLKDRSQKNVWHLLIKFSSRISCGQHLLLSFFDMYFVRNGFARFGRGFFCLPGFFDEKGVFHYFSFSLCRIPVVFPLKHETNMHVRCTASIDQMEQIYLHKICLE